MAKLADVTCECGESFKVPMWRTGQRGKCTTCDKAVVIPLYGSTLSTPQTKQITINHTLTTKEPSGNRFVKICAVLFTLVIFVVASAITAIVVYPPILVDVPLEKVKDRLPEKLYVFLEKKVLEGKYQKIKPQWESLGAELKKLGQKFQEIEQKPIKDKKLKEKVGESIKSVAESKKLFAIQDPSQIILVYKDLSGIIQGLQQDLQRLNTIIERKKTLPGSWYKRLFPTMNKVYTFLGKLKDRREYKKELLTIQRIQFIKQKTLQLDWLWIDRYSKKNNFIGWLKKQEDSQSLVDFITHGEVKLSVDKEIEILENFSKTLSRKTFSKKNFRESRKAIFTIKKQFEDQFKKIFKAMKLIENYEERK